jgi:hypothetical protein
MCVSNLATAEFGNILQRSKCPTILWAEPQFASYIHEVQKEMWVEMTLRVPRNPDQHQNSNLPANCNIRAAYANGDPAADAGVP